MGRRDFNQMFNVTPIRRKRPYGVIAGAFILGIVMGLIILALTPFFLSVGDTLPHTLMREAGTLGSPGCSVVSVHDGDTFRCDGVKVRLVAASGPVDAPEFSGSARCEPGRDGWCDQQLAERSRDRLDALLDSGPIALDCKGADRYGRRLCTASVDGRDAGDTLVAEGLAKIEERWR